MTEAGKCSETPKIVPLTPAEQYELLLEEANILVPGMLPRSVWQDPEQETP